MPAFPSWKSSATSCAAAHRPASSGARGTTCYRNSVHAWPPSSPTSCSIFCRGPTGAAIQRDDIAVNNAFTTTLDNITTDQGISVTSIAWVRIPCKFRELPNSAWRVARHARVLNRRAIRHLRGHRRMASLPSPICGLYPETRKAFHQQMAATVATWVHLTLLASSLRPRPASGFTWTSHSLHRKIRCRRRPARQNPLSTTAAAGGRAITSSSMTTIHGPQSHCAPPLSRCPH